MRTQTYEYYLHDYIKDIITYYKLIVYSYNKIDKMYWKKRINNAIYGFVKITGVLK